MEVTWDNRRSVLSNLQFKYFLFNLTSNIFNVSVFLLLVWLAAYSLVFVFPFATTMAYSMLTLVPFLSIAAVASALVTSVIKNDEFKLIETRISVLEKLDDFGDARQKEVELADSKALPGSQKKVRVQRLSLEEKEILNEYYQLIAKLTDAEDMDFLVYVLENSTLDYSRKITLNNGARDSLFQHLMLKSWTSDDNERIVDAFLGGFECGADLNNFIVPKSRRDSVDEKLLTYAARYNKLYLYKVLWERENIDLKATNSQGDTVLHSLVKNLGLTTEFTDLLARGIRYLPINAKNNAGKTALECAVLSSNNRFYIGTLLDLGENPDLYNSNKPSCPNETLLRKLLNNKRATPRDVIRNLIAKTSVAKLNADIVNDSRQSAIQSYNCVLANAIQNSLYHVAEALLDKEGFDFNGRALLHLAVHKLSTENDYHKRQEIVSILEKLLDKGSDPYLENKGKTFMHELIDRCVRLRAGRGKDKEILLDCSNLLTNLINRPLIDLRHANTGCVTVEQYLTCKGIVCDGEPGRVTLNLGRRPRI